MKSFYYAIWSVILILPVPLKILVELVLLIFVIAFIWLILKYALFWISRLVLFLNVFILGSIRRIFGIFFCGKEQVYVWDERIGHAGKKIDKWVREKGRNITKVRFFNIMKKRFMIILMIVVYVFAILPVFKIERFISDYYVKNIYAVNRMFNYMEKNLTKERDEYPELIKVSKKEDSTKKKKKKKKETQINLVMKEGVLKANLRDAANIDGNSICIILEEDQIVYLNTYENDSERYWLKVSIPTRDNITGWISERVIRDDILDTLNLQ